MNQEHFNKLVETKTSVSVILDAAAYDHETLDQNQFKLLNEMAKNEIEILLSKDWSARQLLDKAHLFQSIRLATRSIDLEDGVEEESFKLEFEMQTKIINYIKNNKHVG